MLNAFAIQRFGLGQRGQLLLRSGNLEAKTCCLGSVLPMPHHQSAGLLKKHRLRQLGQQLWPTHQPVLAHADNGHFGHYRFGQRCQHGGGHAGCAATAIRRAGIVQADAVA